MHLLGLRATLCVAFVTLFAVAFAADRRPEPNRLRIMSYNAQFLWDGVAPEEGDVQTPWRGSPTEAGHHMAAIAARIITEDPDILTLVEVENLAALNRLNTEFLAGRGYNAYLINGRDSQTGQDVGLLTRVDPEGALYRDETKGKSGRLVKGVSKHFIARFDLGGFKFGIVGIHLLARPNDRSRSQQREAQADAVRKFAGDLRTAGYAPIVMGDFNDYDGEPDARDQQNSTPVTNVLKIIRQGDASTTADDLFNAASRVPQGVRFTAWWDQNDNNLVEAPRELTSIDHILIATSIVGRVTSVRIPNNYDTRAISDHYPVVVDFQVGTQPSPHRVFISGVLANPAGSDTDNEAVELTNGGSSVVSLAGWSLRDAAGQSWNLTANDGTIPPQQTVEIVRRGRPMSLNNGGDTVTLLSAANTPIDTVTYPAADESEWVNFGPN